MKRCEKWEALIECEEVWNIFEGDDRSINLEKISIFNKVFISYNLSSFVLRQALPAPHTSYQPAVLIE
jgi:hypothetical protein